MKIQKLLILIFFLNSTMIFSLQNNKEQNEKLRRLNPDPGIHIELLPIIDDSSFFENCTFKDFKEFVEENPGNQNAINCLLDSLLIILIKTQQTSKRTIDQLQEMVKYLISQNVNLNFQNKDGETALIVATRTSSLEIVQLLVEANADLDITNNNFKTAYDIAWSIAYSPRKIFSDNFLKYKEIANYLFNAWLRKNKVLIAEKLNKANDTIHLPNALLSIVQDYLYEAKPKIPYSNRKSKKRKAQEMEESFFKVKKI